MIKELFLEVLKLNDVKYYNIVHMNNCIQIMYVAMFMQLVVASIKVGLQSENKALKNLEGTSILFYWIYAIATGWIPMFILCAVTLAPPDNLTFLSLMLFFGTIIFMVCSISCNLVNGVGIIAWWLLDDYVDKQRVRRMIKQEYKEKKEVQQKALAKSLEFKKLLQSKTHTHENIAKISVSNN